jgi:hypothetical protein
MSIYKAIISAMADIDPIAKNKKNTMQGYNFRGIDDVYNDLQPILAKHGIFTTSKIIADRTEDRTTSKGSALIYRILTIEWTFFHADGTFITTQTVGEGMDSGDKASNKAMAVAHKYALLQLFAIPTEDAKDPENESHQVTHKPTPPKPAPQSDARKKAGEEIKALLADPAFTDSDKAIFRKDFAACKDTDLQALVESVHLALSVKKIIPCDAVEK